MLSEDVTEVSHDEDLDVAWVIQICYWGNLMLDAAWSKNSFEVGQD